MMATMFDNDWSGFMVDDSEFVMVNEFHLWQGHVHSFGGIDPPPIVSRDG